MALPPLLLPLRKEAKPQGTKAKKREAKTMLRGTSAGRGATHGRGGTERVCACLSPPAETHLRVRRGMRLKLRCHAAQPMQQAAGGAAAEEQSAI